MSVAVVACGVVVLGGMTGCGKKKLDKNVDRLVKALQKSDYEDFEKQSRPEVLEDVGKQKFKMMSQAIKSLGKFKDRTMKGIHVKSGGWKEGRYDLEFEKGEIQLRITLKNGKLVGFKFSGDPIEKAMKKAKRKMFDEFRVLGFRFVDEQGKQKSNVVSPGSRLQFQVGVSGLKVREGQMMVKVDLQVANDQNKVVFQKRDFVKQKIPLKKNDPPVATLSGRLRVPKKGSFKIGLKITDLVSGKSVVHQQAFKVE